MTFESLHTQHWTIIIFYIHLCLWIWVNIKSPKPYLHSEIQTNINSCVKCTDQFNYPCWDHPIYLPMLLTDLTIKDTSHFTNLKYGRKIWTHLLRFTLPWLCYHPTWLIWVINQYSAGLLFWSSVNHAPVPGKWLWRTWVSVATWPQKGRTVRTIIGV